MKAIHLFSGHGQLPSGTDLYETCRYATIVLTVNIETGQVIDCVIPNFCTMHNDFIADILRGKNLDSDIAAIIAEIEETVHSLSTRALITALQAAYNRYLVCKNQQVFDFTTSVRKNSPKGRGLERKMID